MSATSPNPPAATEPRIMAIVCYALFIIAVTNGITAIAGVVLAYVKRPEARGTIWQSHFDNLIHVFWSGILVFALFLAAVIFGVSGLVQAEHMAAFPGVLYLVPVLWLLGVVYVVWYLYRTVKGIVQAIDGKAYG